MEKFLWTVGIAAAVIGGIVQAYPSAIPNGDYYVGLTAIWLSLLSLAIAILLHLRARISLKLIKRDILKRAPRSKPISMTFMMGNEASAALADDLNRFLQLEGYTVSVNPGVFSGNFRGLTFNEENESVSIGIGFVSYP